MAVARKRVSDDEVRISGYAALEPLGATVVRRLGHDRLVTQAPRPPSEHRRWPQRLVVKRSRSVVRRPSKSAPSISRRPVDARGSRDGSRSFSTGFRVASTCAGSPRRARVRD